MSKLSAVRFDKCWRRRRRSSRQRRWQYR